MVGRALAAAVALGAALSASVAGSLPDAPPAAAYPAADVTLVGHGYGHGRGMGQWGALGYALAHTSWSAIVSHYYAPATPAALTPAQAAHPVAVVLTENNDSYTIVTSSSGFTAAGRHFTAGQAVMLATNADRATYLAFAGGGCGGPWGATPYAVVANPTVVPDADSVPGDPAAATKALQLCLPGGNLAVRGQLRATYNTASPPAARTVNLVALESYVAGVVPNESPAYWGGLGDAGPQGQAWGFQELEAQAVAARSYVMAALGSYGGYADTCDLACQTYRGLRNESPLSDAAAAATAGQVMEVGADGTPRTTEYSSSTGGYTAPGTFGAVPDVGDAVCVPGACNPHHTWKVTLPVTDIEATWPQLGSLSAVTVTSRNGLGADGGRVLQMVMVGTAQRVTLTGDQFAAAMNLQSNWFSVATSLSAPAVGMAGTTDAKGYWLAGSDGSVLAFGDAPSLGAASATPLNAPVVGLARTATGQGYWLAASDGGIFTFGDATFVGSAGAIRLNKPIVGMAPTPTGHGYWLVASDGGIFSYGDAAFFGSTGSLRLNRPVVGMVRTATGRGYWLVASDGGIFAFGDARFFGSMGGLHLNAPVVGMTGTPDGGGYRMVASDGGIFSFGDATFYGSAGSIALAQPIVGMAPTATGHGYWLVASDGGIFTYGDAGYFGSGAA